MTETRRIHLGVVRDTSTGLAIRATSTLGAPDHVTYSRFKYGCGSSAQRFGRRLADCYWSALDAAQRSAPHLVSCSGYASAPPAAHALVEPFVTRLEDLAGAEGRSLDLRVFKIDRGRLAGEDYAYLSTEQRARVIDRSDLRLPADLELPAGAQVVAIDDVRVTGLHARRIDALYAGGDLTVWHACLLETDGDPHPSLEAVLNAGSVDHIDRLVTLANEATYIPNARACRFVLSEAGRARRFVDAAPLSVATALLAFATDDALASFPRYTAGYHELTQALHDLAPTAGHP